MEEIVKKIKRTDLEKRNYKWIALFLLPSLAIFTLFYLVPIVTVLFTSFTEWNGFNTPVFVGVQNYIKLFSTDTFKISVRNLLCWGLIAGTVHVAYGVVIAFIFVQKPFGWKFTRAVYMIPNVISASAWAIIYKFVFNNDIGVLNNLIRTINPDFNVQWFYQSPYAFLAITFTWVFYSVIVTLVVYNDLMSVPSEVLEAAQVDGATGWKIISKIQLPLCRNSIGTSVILAVTARIAMYEQILLTTSGGPGDDTMNLPIILVNSITDMRYGYANAVGVVMFVLGVLILVTVNKLFKMNESVY